MLRYQMDLAAASQPAGSWGLVATEIASLS